MTPRAHASTVTTCALVMLVMGQLATGGVPPSPSSPPSAFGKPRLGAPVTAPHGSAQAAAPIENGRMSRSNPPADPIRTGRKDGAALNGRRPSHADSAMLGGAVHENGMRRSMARP